MKDKYKDMRKWQYITMSHSIHDNCPTAPSSTNLNFDAIAEGHKLKSEMDT